MGGLVGYMARIGDEVAVCETTRICQENKLNQPIRGNEMEVLTDQCSTDHRPSLPHNQRPAKDVSFS